MKELLIDKMYNDIRFNKYLSKLLVNANQSYIYKMLRKKNILLNDKSAKGNEMLKAGDKVSIYFKDETYDKFTNKALKVEKAEDYKLELEKLKSSIIYEDENIIIIDKWEGILSQSDKTSRLSLDKLCKIYLDDQDAHNENMKTMSIVNRLDTNTLGLIVFAKNYNAAKYMANAFKNRNVEKHYLALVEGKLKNKEETLVLYMYKDSIANKVNVISKEYYDRYHNTKYYETITKYKVLEERVNTSLIDIELVTGKSHQIRAAMSYIGNPIVNDHKYGSNILVENNKSLALISYMLIFNDMEDEYSYLNNKIFHSNYKL